MLRCGNTLKSVSETLLLPDERRNQTLLVQHGGEDVADAYLRSRLDHDWGSEFGTLPPDAPLQRRASRAVPST